MSPEQIRLEALKLALTFKGADPANPVDKAKVYEQYIAGDPEKSGPADTVKEPGTAAPKVRKSRPAEAPTP